MNTKKLSALLLTAGLAAVCSGPAVAGITGVQVSPATAKITSAQGVEVKITVNGDEESKFCGLRVEFGDNDGRDVKIDSDEGLFPRTITRTYTKPGSYTIQAKGKKVTTHFSCPGEAKTTLTVEGGAAPATGKKAASGASCPDGWTLKGKAGKDGSFTCAPKTAGAAKPAAKLECGPGLAYFEKGSSLGCRKAGK